MSATTTVWPLLAAAGIAVAGTLGAAVLTEWRAARREELRWKRERRDRQEADRREQYANLINILHTWQSGVESIRTEIAKLAALDAAGLGTEDPEPEIDVVSMFWPHRDAARQALAMVDLLAPAEVRSLGDSAVQAGETFSVAITQIYLADAATELDAASKRFRETRAALNDAMRDDLGLQPKAEVAERDKT